MLGLNFLARARRHSPAALLYRRIVEQARQPLFYTALGIPDTPDGRFELIALHLALVLRRLQRQQPESQFLGEELACLMVADFDQNLRELGVGDLVVGKRVTAMTKNFYGRLTALNAALASGEEPALALALSRVLFRIATPSQTQVARLAAYVREQIAVLDGRSLDDLEKGAVFRAPGA